LMPEQCTQRRARIAAERHPEGRSDGLTEPAHDEYLPARAGL
jgi:hypothetical protein